MLNGGSSVGGKGVGLCIIVCRGMCVDLFKGFWLGVGGKMYGRLAAITMSEVKCKVISVLVGRSSGGHIGWSLSDIRG